MFDVISSKKSPKEKTCYLKGHGSGRFSSFFEIQSDWQEQKKKGPWKPHLIFVLRPTADFRKFQEIEK